MNIQIKNTFLHELLLSIDLLDFLWIFFIYTLGNSQIGMDIYIDWEQIPGVAMGAKTLGGVH